MPKRNRNNMPEGFEPPVPAWAADWSSKANSLTTCIFAVQGTMTESFSQWATDALYGSDFAPELVDKAKFTDLEGLTNTVYIAYWRDSDYQHWWSNDDASGWWQNDKRVEEGVGYWREQYTTPIERLETLHSTPNAHGVANLAEQLEGPVDEHAYAGAARDRIQVSGSENLSRFMKRRLIYIRLNIRILGLV